MPVVEGSKPFTAIVKQPDGKDRVYKDVLPATTEGMAYSPEQKGLKVVKEPNGNYRTIKLSQVVEEIFEKPNIEDINKYIEERKAFHHPATKLRKRK